jgi:hypothetical protein
MGIDCKLGVMKMYGLDRIWVFLPRFEEKRYYNRREARGLLEELREACESEGAFEEMWEGTMEWRQVGYCRAWIEKAQKVVEGMEERELVGLFGEHKVPDAYYDGEA